MANVTNITPPRVPLTDPRTGYIAREWYLFFLNLFSRSGDASSLIEDLQKGPPADVTSDATLLGQADLITDGDPVVFANINKLTKDIQALSLAPANTPQSLRKRYASFYDTTTQTAAAINTPYGITYNSVDLSYGVYRGTPTSRVYVDTRNVYDVQFSAQVDKTSGGVGLLWIWLRKNGVDIPNSASQVRIQGNDAELVAAWNFLLELNAGDYFELMWAVDTVDIQLTAFAAAAFRPAIPSIILTVTDNISA